MKKLIVFILVLAPFLATPSCKKDKNSSPTTTTESIIGTWKAINYTSTVDSNGIRVINDTYTFDEQNSLVLSFGKGGSMVQNVLGTGSDALFISERDKYPLVGTYKIAGKQVILYDNYDENILLYYEVIGNNLTLSDTVIHRFDNLNITFTSIEQIHFKKQ